MMKDHISLEFSNHFDITQLAFIQQLTYDTASAT